MLLFLYQPSFGQSKIDSLLKIINYGQDDTNKVKAYGALSDEYGEINAYKTISYGIEGLRLSVKLHYLVGMADCLNKIGVGYIDIGDYSKALNYLQKSLSVFKIIKDQIGIAVCYNNLGLIYYARGNFNKSIKYHFDALKVYDSVKSTSRAQICYNIGIMYLHAKNNALSLKYINKALEYCIESKNKELVSQCLVGIGNIYVMQGNDSVAIKYYNKALKYREGNSANNVLAQCLINMCGVYSRKGKEYLALQCIQEALKMKSYFNDKRGICIAGLNLASLYNQMGNYRSAIDVSLKSLEIAREMGLTENIMLCKKCLSVNYAGLGEFKKAYEYYQDYKECSDSIYNISTSKHIKELEARYESEKKEKEILIQKNRIEILGQKEIISDYEQWGFTILIFIIISVSIISVRNQKRKILLSRKMFEAQKKLKEAELKNERMKSEQLQTEKLLSEAELNNERLKSEQLQNDLDFQTKENIYKTKELEYKNKEIVNFALHIVEKNEFINKLRITIERSEKSLKPKDLIHVIEHNVISLEKERKEFESKIEEISRSFTTVLQENIPDITRNEKRLASLLRLNLTSKEISMILDISMQSVDTYRCRLRKKLNLAKDESLTEHLNNI